MHPWTEYAFLNELYFLCDAAFKRGERIETLARNWSEIDRKVRKTLEARPQDKSREERATEQRFRARAYGDQVNRQSKFVIELDAFLGLYGRTGLMLFPQKEDDCPKRRDRAETLRAVIEIDEDHPMSNRLLRNKWVHFDEVLDQLDAEEEEIGTPLRFVSSDRVDPSDPPPAIRLLVLDTLKIHYQGYGWFDLRTMIQTFRELDPMVSEALRTWEDRRLPELAGEE